MTPAEQRLRKAWEALQRDPSLSRRASFRLARQPALPCKVPGRTGLFFPDTGDHGAVTAAVRLCGDCPELARLDCLVVNLAAGNSRQYGVSGGTTARSRTAFLRRQHRTEEERRAG